MRVPLPGWVLAFSALGFVATWAVAPPESLSGAWPDLPDRPAARRPHCSAAQALPAARPAPPRPPGSLFAVSQPNQVALTFDDGPHHFYTARLLQILAARGARATFFVNGWWLDEAHTPHAERNREIVARAFREGHLVGNHGYHHLNLGQLAHSDQDAEILGTEEIIERVLGVRPFLFRPAYGVLTRHAAALLQERGYVVVRWNAAVEDEEQRSPEEIRDRVLLWLRRHGGGIVMLHDRNRSSVEAAELILLGIEQESSRRQARGEPPFHVVPLDSFLSPPAESGARGAAPSAQHQAVRVEPVEQG